MLKSLKKLGLPSQGSASERFDTLVGYSTHIQGRLLLIESARIDGKVMGNVETVPENNVTVVVGARGEVIGDISAYRVVVAGKVRGNINAVERVELQTECLVQGDISYGALSVHLGARLQGLVIQKEKETAPDQGVQGVQAIPALQAVLTPQEVQADQTVEAGPPSGAIPLTPFDTSVPGAAFTQAAHAGAVLSGATLGSVAATVFEEPGQISPA
jgi:cytoskeletal protein CcmA (bactofilin family)